MFPSVGRISDGKRYLQIAWDRIGGSIAPNRSPALMARRQTPRSTFPSVPKLLAIGIPNHKLSALLLFGGGRLKIFKVFLVLLRQIKHFSCA
jgi:hypothetical protein